MRADPSTLASLVVRGVDTPRETCRKSSVRCTSQTSCCFTVTLFSFCHCFCLKQTDVSCTATTRDSLLTSLYVRNGVQRSSAGFTEAMQRYTERNELRTCTNGIISSVTSQNKTPSIDCVASTTVHDRY